MTFAGMSVSLPAEPDPDERRRLLEEENARLKRIQGLVDRACAVLAARILTEDGVRRIIADTRRRVLELAPGCEAQYDLIYAPRLERWAKPPRPGR